jgi:hypothetical protein
MPDTVQFPDYFAQATDHQLQQQKLAQQMALTQNLQFENAQAQKTASRADQFMQAMQQQAQQNPGASWHEKIAGATSAAIASGDYSDADKLIGTWSKASDQEAKALADGQKAVTEDLANKQKKFAQQSAFLSGVSSQQDLDDRRAAYKQAYGEDLPFQQYTPGMDKRFEDISISALDRAKIVSEQVNAKVAQQKAQAEIARDNAQSALEREKINTEKTIQEKNTKEGAKFAAQAAAGGGTGANTDRYGYTQNVINAGINATVDLDNLSKLPEGSGISWMSGMSDKTGPALTDALRANFARSLTPADRQAYKAAAAGLSNALSIMQTNGRNATAGMRHANQEATDINENDKADAAAYKLARVRQEIEVANESMQVNPKATPEQKQKFQQIADKAAKAVPFTTEDAVKALSPAKARTLAQAFNEKISKAKGEVTDDGIPKTNAKGWTLHTDADGNKAYVSPDGKNYEEVQ